MQWNCISFVHFNKLSLPCEIKFIILPCLSGPSTLWCLQWPSVNDSTVAENVWQTLELRKVWRACSTWLPRVLSLEKVHGRIISTGRCPCTGKLGYQFIFPSFQFDPVALIIDVMMIYGPDNAQHQLWLIKRSASISLTVDCNPRYCKANVA